MKKKFLSVLTCLGLIFVCLFVATGCDEAPDAKIYVSTAQELTVAVNNAKDDAVIVLENNIDVPAQINVNEEITIDLNGHKLYNTNNIWDEANSQWSIFSVKENGELTITGNGEIDAKDGDCYAIDVRGGECTIKNGKITGNVHAIYVYTGELEVDGGEFNLKQLSIYDDYRYELNIFDANNRAGTAKIEVKGGKFYKYDPNASISENPLADFVPEGYQSVADGDYYVVSKIV